MSFDDLNSDGRDVLQRACVRREASGAEWLSNFTARPRLWVERSGRGRKILM